MAKNKDPELIERLVFMLDQAGHPQYCSDCNHWLVAAWPPGAIGDKTLETGYELAAGNPTYICPRCVLGRAKRAEEKCAAIRDILYA